MKMYFGLFLSIFTISFVQAMDENNNNKPVPQKELTAAEKDRKLKEQDLKNENKIKEILTQMEGLYVDAVSKGLLPSPSVSKKQPQDSNQSSMVIIHPSQNPSQPTIITTYTTLSVQTTQNSQNTNTSSSISSPALSRLAEGLKNTSLNSPIPTKKSLTDQNLQSNNNNDSGDEIGSGQKVKDDSSDDYQSDEENSPFTQRIREKNWEHSNKLKSVAYPVSQKEIQGAVDEHLIALNILYQNYVHNSPKEEEKGADMLNAIKSSQPKSNNNNDQKDNDNNKKS